MGTLLLLADGEPGLPPIPSNVPMPWWVTALLIVGGFLVHAVVMLRQKTADIDKLKAEIRQTNTNTDLKIEAAKEAAKREDENSARAQWKEIARNEIKLRGEAEERHRKEMSELVAATRTEIHEVRNELGARINAANAEIKDVRDKEWRCQRRMARFEGIAEANGWDMSGLHDVDEEPIPPPAKE